MRRKQHFFQLFKIHVFYKQVQIRNQKKYTCTKNTIRLSVCLRYACKTKGITTEEQISTIGSVSLVLLWAITQERTQIKKIHRG